MCDKIDFKTAKFLVELGPGTGVFTTEILKRALPDAKIFVIELNDNFYNLLTEKIKDSRVVLLNKSADQLDVILKEHGVDHVDAIDRKSVV